MCGGGGGAWKVAYADFVTAMMALFMVLWISAQDKEILISTSQYFQSPFRSPLEATSGVMPFNSNKTTQSQGKGSEKDHEKDKQISMTFLNSVAADFYRLLHLDEALEGKPIDIQVTTDGLRVSLFNRANRPVFVPGTTELTEWGNFVLQNMAWTIDRHTFNVTIDGHARVDTAGTGIKPNYTIWELSADRANAARRALVHYAVGPRQIERVTGYGATKPVPNEPAASDSNDRITLNLTLSAKDRPKDGKLVDKKVPILPAEKPYP
jgi:chemotaxis protein MotB